MPTKQPAERITGRGAWDEHTSLRLYLREASETPLLTIDDEVRLAKRIRAGDEVAREHMIKANLRLVVKIAREYESYGLPLLDLINEGNIGLMRAVERFDPINGAKLSTYAAWWIKQSIMRALSNQVKPIRLPIHLSQKISQMRRAANRLEMELGRPPSDSELALALEVTEDDIEHMRASSNIGVVSLEAPLGNDADAGTVSDIIPDEGADTPWANIDRQADAALALELISTLEERFQIILRERFGFGGKEPRTLEDIAASFGLTRERIRQLESMALKRLRKRLENRDPVGPDRTSNRRSRTRHRRARG